MGFAVLVAAGNSPCSAKMGNLTSYQSHNYESFVFKIGVGDTVSRYNNPAKFGWDKISDGAPRGGDMISDGAPRGGDMIWEFHAFLLFFIRRLMHILIPYCTRKLHAHPHPILYS